MLTATKGIIHSGNIMADMDLRNYEGVEVIITMLTVPGQNRTRQKKKKDIDWDSFITPCKDGERGKDVDAYMREMRDNDRL